MKCHSQSCIPDTVLTVGIPEGMTKGVTGQLEGSVEYGERTDVMKIDILGHLQ